MATSQHKQDTHTHTHTFKKIKADNTASSTKLVIDVTIETLG